MKKEELMLGDWVYNTHNRQNEQVAEIGSGLVMLEYNDLYEYDEIEPIPMSPEILEANGWKRQSFGDMVLVIKKPERRLVYHADNILTITRDDSTYERRKRKVLLSMFTDYVHEFQHALRLCGIEKEIKLPKEV